MSDPTLAPAFELRGDEQDPLATVVFQCLGGASVCWEFPGAAGVFDSTRAKQIGDELVAWIRENYAPKPGSEVTP
jgi:hypothetical protein